MRITELRISQQGKVPYGVQFNSEHKFGAMGGGGGICIREISYCTVCVVEAGQSYFAGCGSRVLDTNACEELFRWRLWKYHLSPLPGFPRRGRPLIHEH